MQLLLSFTCPLHYFHKILTSYKNSYFLIFGSLGPPGLGVGSGQGSNEHQPDTKCNSHCHLYVHYVILTNFYQVISIFIFLISGVLCGRVRVGWGGGGDGGGWTIWYVQIYIFRFYIPVSLHLCTLRVFLPHRLSQKNSWNFNLTGFSGHNLKLEGHPITKWS